MESLFFTITFIYFIFQTNGADVPGVRLRELLQDDVCCSEAGAAQGLLCGCRQACTGNSCNSGGNFGISASCGTGVCCCGNGCIKPLKPELDSCPTQQPTVNPTGAPTANPSENPTVNPSANPSTNPSVNPSVNPSLSPTPSPSANPSVSPTVPQCAEWSPETSNPTTNPSTIPVPDTSKTPQLCQLGKSGEWNSLDRWYSWDCSCYDALTRFILTQFIQGWFMEFQINYTEQQQDGRFESYFNNYCTDNIFMETSLSDRPAGTGRNWNDLESLTSCDPSNPGYGELSRQLMQTMDFQIVPGGVSMRNCVENGHVASARVIIDNYRLRDVTENQVVFGDFIVERQNNTNIWLIKEIVFTGNTVGFLL